MAKINWEAERDAYVAGSESFAQVAKRLGVSKRGVERHALNRSVNGGQTWGELRETFRAGVSERAAEVASDEQAAALAAVRARHAETLKWLADLSRENIADALKRCSAKDKVKYGLAIIALERRVHGLDRMKVEVSGTDGKPIEHDFALDDATRDLAERALEALFGSET
jgi:hypothetical protein